MAHSGYDYGLPQPEKMNTLISAATAAQRPLTLEAAIEKLHETNSTLHDIRNMIEALFDRLHGQRPEKLSGVDQAPPVSPGQLHSLHNTIDDNRHAARQIAGRIEELLGLL